MGKLEGKRALITGSSSGIGAGVAIAFAREGADVAVNYPGPAQRDDADRVVNEIAGSGRKGHAIEADVSDADHVGALVDSAVGSLGGIDILVNNAGFAETVPVHEMSIDSWDRMMAVHLRSVFLATRLVLPLMYAQDYGKIINTGSQLAYKAAPGYAHYTAAKAAIIAFTRSLALEIGERNINANCVCPGATNTPLFHAASDELLASIRRSIPKGRIAEVAEIVPSYVFLASEESSFYHGQSLSPNGGDVFL